MQSGKQGQQQRPGAAPQQAMQKSQATASLDRPASNFGDLKALLSRADVLEQIKLTLPQHMKPERMAKVMLSAINKTPALMKVNQLSLLQTLGQLSELGLEPGGAWGHVYLIPFENRKEGRTDVNVIIGYRGLIELARRSGAIEQIEANVVFEGDRFELRYGLQGTRSFVHEPDLTVDRTSVDNARAVYCIARLKGGGEHLEVMTMREVYAIRDASQGYKTAVKYGKSDSPWLAHPLEMARKTVIRRTCKYLPLSAEIREGLELERDEEVDAAEAGRNVLGVVRRPGEAAAAAVSDLANQMAAIASRQQPEDAELVAEDPPGMNPETGEVPSAAPAPDEPEPEAGTTHHLLWRVNRAEAAALPELVKEAQAIPKDDPLRGQVGTAISERRKVVAQ